MIRELLSLLCSSCVKEDPDADYRRRHAAADWNDPVAVRERETDHLIQQVLEEEKRNRR